MGIAPPVSTWWPIACATCLLGLPAVSDAATGDARAGDLAVRHFHRGLDVIRRALAAAGGQESLDALRAIQITVDGGLSNATQYASPAVMNEVHPEPISISVGLDFQNGRYRQEINQTVRGGLGVRSIFAFSDEQLSIIWPDDERYSRFPATPDAIISFGGSMVPALLLKEAVNNFASISWEGHSEIDGEKTSVVGFSWNNQKRYFLHVSDNTSLVRGLEYVQADALLGDDNVLVIFEGSQYVQGIHYPERVRQFRWQRPYADVVLQLVAVNGDVEISEDTEIAAYEQAPPPIPVWHRVAANVFEVRNLFVGNYRSVIVELDDSVVVFDAPIGPHITAQVRKLIAQNLGAKPISHVVLSHYHLDHVGGLGVYAAEGATIVTAPGNEEFFEQIASAHSRAAAPFSDSPRASELKFSIVDRGRTIELGNKGQTIEVTNIGPVSHVDSMLVAYVNDAGVAINGDLYSPRADSNASYEQYRQWLRTNHADTKLVTGVHHDPVAGESFFDEHEE